MGSHGVHGPGAASSALLSANHCPSAKLAWNSRRLELTDSTVVGDVEGTGG
eukprot:CAMPEP_0197122678 /NCGR_PEP_ID=MMETSP1390-20130617/5155_1 /TAXON_ID=38833 /ORGANISM="Micromonas sp., Strain CCMP2099" /LENGTH=50 /DNA_ID=CAMNT_0042564669 /DNA_START=540 /DNA_END=688 /DNA_ORIENTATION=-